MNQIDHSQLPADYERDGVVRNRQFLSVDEVVATATPPA